MKVEIPLDERAAMTVFTLSRDTVTQSWLANEPERSCISPSCSRMRPWSVRYWPWPSK